MKNFLPFPTFFTVIYSHCIHNTSGEDADPVGSGGYLPDPDPLIFLYRSRIRYFLHLPVTADIYHIYRILNAALHNPAVHKERTGKKKKLPIKERQKNEMKKDEQNYRTECRVSSRERFKFS